ncbi:MAG: hypothetical protein CUN57_00175 [Phototrophicales bacterium]|nr:MAG: hypothetical protein CUN57_00175 [Phototrophicales bacterium]
MLFVTGGALGCMKRCRYDINDGWFLLPFFGVASWSLYLLSQVVVVSGGRGYDDPNINAITVGYYGGLLAVCLVVFVLLDGSVWFRLICLLIGVVAFILIFTSGSRGPLLALLCSILLVGFCRGWFIRRKIVAFLLVAIVCVGSLYMAFVWIQSTPGGEKRISLMEDRLERLVSDVMGERVDASTSGRREMWVYFVERWRDVLPIGMPGYDVVDYPHNQFVEFYVRYGILGLVFSVFSLIIFLWSVRYVILHRSNIDRVTLVSFAIFVFAYLQSMTSLSLELNRFLWYGFGYFFGVLVFSRRRKRNFG